MKKLSELVDSNVVLVTNHDDWEALYVNGVSIYQAHDIDARDLAKHSLEQGKLYNVIESSYDELYDIGNYPDKIDDIPEWQRITLSDDTIINPD